MSPLGLKATVGSALFELCGGVHDIHSLRFTSTFPEIHLWCAGVYSQHSSWLLPHMRVLTEVGCRI